MDLLSENNKALEWCGGDARAPSDAGGMVHSLLQSELNSPSRSFLSSEKWWIFHKEPGPGSFLALWAIPKTTSLFF